MLQPRPVAGWADAEARRIRDVALRAAAAAGANAPAHAWVYFAHYGGAERNDMIAALARLGGHVVALRAADTVVLYRVRFDAVDGRGADARG
jgi:hypothetical protein